MEKEGRRGGEVRRKTGRGDGEMMKEERGGKGGVHGGGAEDGDVIAV